jgi:DNA primase
VRSTEPTWDEIASHYGLTLRLQGSQLRGACPLHGGTNPTAFVIDPNRGVFFCHSCGQGGGLQTFLHAMEGGTGSGRDGQARTDGHARRRAPSLFELQRLAQNRNVLLCGLPEVEPVYPRDATHPYFASRGVDVATVVALGGGVYTGPGPFNGRAVFPVWTPEGKLVGHVGRAIDPDVGPRYLCERGFRKSLLLFHEQPGQATGTVIVVEGIFDALAVVQAGFQNVVALIGCMASDSQLATLSRYRQVVSLLDGDDAGREGARLLKRVLGKRVTVVDLGEGDPGAATADRLRSALASAVCEASLTLPTDGPPFAAPHLTARRSPCT